MELYFTIEVKLCNNLLSCDAVHATWMASCPVMRLSIYVSLCCRLPILFLMGFRNVAFPWLDETPFIIRIVAMMFQPTVGFLTFADPMVGYSY